jgi:hypothetical protein
MMAEPDRDPNETTPVEGAPQPGSRTNESRAGAVRSFAVTAVIVATLLGVMYGVTAHRVEVQDAHRQSAMQRDVPPFPAVTKPGG